MRYKVVISEGEDGWYVVECPSIPGCVSQGKTIEEARGNIKDAIQGCLDVLNEKIEIKGEEKLMEVAVWWQNYYPQFIPGWCGWGFR